MRESLDAMMIVGEEVEAIVRTIKDIAKMKS